MYRFILVILLNVVVQTFVFGQDFIISVNTTYGTYFLSDFKRLQNELYEEAVSSINVPFKVTDNFPGYIGFGINLDADFDKFESGFQISGRSTGGRISYSDYSGKNNIDNYLKSIETIGHFGTKLNRSENFDFILKAKLGLAFTSYTLSSNFQLTNQPADSEDLDFSSINLVIGAEAKLRFSIYRNLTIETFLGYDKHIPGTVNYSLNNDYHLIDNAGKEIKADWSGVRVGLGVGIRI